jgi:molybdopterin-guanine dinucleotide biosynthesis protein A
MTETTWGLVLAGGKSSRMGHDKALLQRDGKSQLKHVVDVLGSVLPRVFVSTRSDQQDEPERAQYEQIVDRYHDMGPVAGVLSAMEAHPEVNWLVVACDLPNIDATTVGYLLQNISAAQPFTAYKSSHDELPEPLCAVYRAGSDAIIRGFVDDGIKCPRKMLIRSDTLLLTQPDPSSLDNVNTPDDLHDSILEAVS